MSPSANGFTLLEVLVALVIIGMTGLGALGLSMQLARGSDSARSQVIARALALSSLEESIVEGANATPPTVYAPPFDQFQYAIRVRSAGRTRSYTSIVTWKGGRIAFGRVTFSPATVTR